MPSRTVSASLRHMNGAQRSSAWMIRIGWVLTCLSGAYMMLDGMGKFLAPPQLLSEFQRLGEREITMIPLGILQFTVGLVYSIPRTSILGAIRNDWLPGGRRSASDPGERQRGLSDHPPAVSWRASLGRDLAARRETTEPHPAADAASASPTGRHQRFVPAAFRLGFGSPQRNILSRSRCCVLSSVNRRNRGATHRQWRRPDGVRRSSYRG